MVPNSRDAPSTWPAPPGSMGACSRPMWTGSAPIPSEGVEEFCARFLEGGWEAQDVRSRRGIPLARKAKGIVTDADFVTSDEQRQLPLYADFLPSVGFGSFAGTILTETGGAKIALSLHRKAHREPFSKDDLARLRHDLTHVRRAARLAAKVRMSYADGLVDSLGALHLRSHPGRLAWPRHSPQWAGGGSARRSSADRRIAPAFAATRSQQGTAGPYRRQHPSADVTS